MPSKFPKPERGVERYEVWEWAFLNFRVGSAWVFVDSVNARSKADRGLKRLAGDEVPAYIYDRKTGEVIATNEDALKAQENDNEA